jgi:hypothetical protein
VIEPTDEMVQAFNSAAAAARTMPRHEPYATHDGIAAVLRIVERDQAGPCSAGLPIIFGGGRAWCTLRHGHQGDHIDGTTRWRETGATRLGPS